MGWPTETPEPSRRGSIAGRSTGAPLAAAATAGEGPTQASWRTSSPLRKRWQRTPPVPRPLLGYSSNGVTFTLPASVPGSAVDEPATDGIFRTGVLANVLQLLKLPDGTVKVLVEGRERVQITGFVPNENYFEATCDALTEEAGAA